MAVVSWCLLLIAITHLVTSEVAPQPNDGIDHDTVVCNQQFSCLQANTVAQHPYNCTNPSNFPYLDTLIPSALCERLVVASNTRRKRSALFNFDLYPDIKWDTEIFIKISDDFSGVQINRTREAVSVWRDNTCLDFTEKKTEEDVAEVHLVFQPGTGCLTFVGRGEKEEQPVYLGDSCFSPPGQIVREIGHALGLWDEHRRQDRADYVNIFNDKIIEEEIGNFAQLPSESSLTDESFPYDLSSIMHYTPTTYVKTAGTYSMVPTNELFLQTIGQRVAPSFGDFQHVNEVYCRDSCQVRVTCANGGVPHHGIMDGNTCRLCKCRDGFAMSEDCQEIEKFTFATIPNSINPSGAPCTFPFKYRGRTYSKCTTVRNNGRPWCSTTPNYAKYKTWGNCPADRDENCGGELRATVEEKAIVSPNYESNGEYMLSQQCTWRIKPQNRYSNKNIRLRFVEKFGIYCKDGVAYHYVEIRYLNNIIELGPRFCGETTPDVTLDSDNSEVMVLFRALYDNSGDDDQIPRRGFKLMYSLVPDCDTINCDSDGGECKMDNGQPICECRLGYTGLECDERTCEGTDCLNGGTCRIRSNVPVCDCAPGFTGHNCSDGSGGTNDCEVFDALPGYLYSPIVLYQEPHTVQVHCLYDTPCGFFDWRCRSDRSRDACFDDVMVDVYGCCDKVPGLQLVEYCGQSFCAVEGWSDFGECEGYTCGMCGIKRRYMYSIVSNGRTGPNQKNFYQECGMEIRPCGQQPCTSCRNRRESSSSSSSSSEEHHRGHRGKRDIWDFLDTLLGPTGGRGGPSGCRCEMPCCDGATLNDNTGLCESDLSPATTPHPHDERPALD